MILYEIFPNKKLKILEDENTYITENLISSVHIKLPSTFGDYPVKELTAELRFYFPDGDYMAYAVDTQQARPEVPITNDITEKPQTLSVMLFFYKGGNVIGKTNSVDKVILDAPLRGEPLTPRAEADEKIREQQEKIAEQVETITEQAGTISSQGEQITELSGEVTELTTENTRLENLTETQRQTIQNMIDNPPQPQLYTPPVVTPSGSVQQISPPTGYDGLTNTVVDRVTAEGVGFNPEWYKEGKECLGKVGTYDPFPYNSVGGIYITEIDEDFNVPIKFVIINLPLATAPFIYNKNYIQEIIFENCSSVKSTGGGFSDCRNLKKLILTSTSIKVGDNFCDGCISLMELSLPQQLENIGFAAFRNCKGLANLYLPATLTTINNGAFPGCTKLENVVLGENFNCSLNISYSTRYSQETIVSWLEALADRTGQTAYTLTMGTTNLNKLTAEEKAIATNKNWNLA